MMHAEKENSAASFVASEVFARTFREGMWLVEETANYLDGAGRENAKTLSRSSALAYAGASMRLTTLLMQIASWLLILRAVREGEMKVEEACDEKFRLKPRETLFGDLRSEGVPETLINLMESTSALYARIARIDADLFSGRPAAATARDAAAQQRALLDAFGQKKLGRES
jgi:regulator of CtrA degradation